MDEFFQHDQLPRNIALGTLQVETRNTIVELDAQLGHPSLISVGAARYAERNGLGSEQDYLNSIKKGEGIIIPPGSEYTQALGHFDRLIDKPLPSQLRDQIKAGRQRLPKGTLIHAMAFDPDALTTIALTGVAARDFSPDVDGDIVNDDIVCSAFFFEAPWDSDVAPLLKSLSGTPMAKKRLPGAENGSDSIAMIFDASINDPDYQALIASQSEDYAARPKAKANNAVAIPVGLPAGGIAGFVVGENVTADGSRLEHIRSLFPDVPLLTPAGTIIQ